MHESSAQIKSSEGNDVTLDLETLLQSPKKTSSDWQAETARLTAVEHNKTLSTDTSDFEYMRSLALCRWAQTAGVIAAKKKNIQATRFRITAPPSLDLLGNAQLVNAALDLMVSLRGDWCKDYIAAQLQKQLLDKKNLTRLLEWAVKTSQSAAELLETVLLNSIASIADEKKALMLIKDVGSQLTFTQNLSAETAALNFLAAVRFINKLIATGQSKKITSALTSLIEIAIQKVRNTHPTVVMHGPFVIAIQSIQEQLAETSNKKTGLAIASRQISSTLTVLADLCSTGGQDGISYAKSLLPSLRNVYPNFEKQLDEAARTNTLLLELKDTDSNNGENSLEDSATSIYARLLPSWHDYFTAHDDHNNLSLLHASLLEAAKLNGIEFLGQVGEVLPFDPVIHRLQKDDQTATDNVRILRPAVIFRRTNSSYRIVLPAIVSHV
jgi:hypothetical protein